MRFLNARYQLYSGLIVDHSTDDVVYQEFKPQMGPALGLLLGGIGALLPCFLIQLSIPSGKGALRALPPPPQVQEAREKAFAASMPLPSQLPASTASADVGSVIGARAAEPGVLRVHLSHAVGVQSKDRNGFSDPYAKLMVAKRTVRSRKVEKTLNPHWNEDFEFTGTLGELTAEPMLVSVWDHDLASRNDPLGDGRVDLRPLASKARLECSVTLDDKQEAPGEVFLQLEWRPDEPENIAAAAVNEIATVISDNVSRVVTRLATRFADESPLPPSTIGEQHYYVMAWEGPRVGECNEDTLSFGQLRVLCSAGHMPESVLVWPKQGGTEWRSLGEVMRGSMELHSTAEPGTDEEQMTA